MQRPEYSASYYNQPSPALFQNTEATSRYNDAIFRSTINRSRPTPSRVELKLPKADPKTNEFFYFKDRRGHFDWRTLATVDVERVIRDVDLSTLQALVENITFADIEAERPHRYADPEFIKIIRLLQLMTEYLLHVQIFLDVESNQAREEMAEASKKVEVLATQIQKDEEELQNLRKENKKMKKSISVYELLLKLPANVRNLSDTKGSTGYHRCPLCNKAFASFGYLQKHVERRHPDQTDSPLIQSILQQKADFSMSAANISTGAIPEGTGFVPEWRQLRDSLMAEIERLKDSEKEQRTRMEATLARERELLRQKEEELDRTQHQQHLKYEEELRRFQNSLRKEFYDHRASMIDQERKVDSLRQQVVTEKFTTAKSGSGFGQLQDAEGGSGKKKKPKRTQIDNELESIHNMEENLRQESERIRKEYEKQMQELKKQNERDIRRERRKMEEENRKVLEALEREQEEIEMLRQRKEKMREMEEEDDRRERKKKQAAKQVEEIQEMEEDPPSEEEEKKKKKIPVSQFEPEGKEEPEEEEEEEADSDSSMELPVTGKYAPVRERPYISSLYNHSLDSVRKKKLAVIELLHQQLHKYNIPEQSTRVSDKQFNEILEKVHSMRRQKPEVAESRTKIIKKVNEIVAQHYKPKYSAAKNNDPDLRRGPKPKTPLRQDSTPVIRTPTAPPKKEPYRVEEGVDSMDEDEDDSEKHSPQIKRKISSVESPKATENQKKKTMSTLAAEASKFQLRRQSDKELPTFQSARNVKFEESEEKDNSIVKPRNFPVTKTPTRSDPMDNVDDILEDFSDDDVPKPKRLTMTKNDLESSNTDHELSKILEETPEVEDFD